MTVTGHFSVSTDKPLPRERARGRPGAARGLRRVAMSLVPSGESLLTVTPSDVATGSELRALLGSVGFELTLRRHEQLPSDLIKPPSEQQAHRPSHP